MILLVDGALKKSPTFDAKAKAEVIASNNDEEVSNHVRITEFTIERASCILSSDRMSSSCLTAPHALTPTTGTRKWNDTARYRHLNPKRFGVAPEAESHRNRSSPHRLDATGL